MRISTDRALTELVERVSAATGPDRKIDCLIAVALDGFYEIPPRYDGDEVGYGYIDRDGARIEPGHGGAQLVKRYTASIDAALALVERMLPGWACGFDGGAKTIIAFCDPEDFDDRMFGAHFTAKAPTVPLAILSALLAALSKAGSQ